MIKAFLSHSSKDKAGYVRNVANWLEKDNIVYDEFTFEEGERSLDEILLGLDKAELFVFFISENSLNSEWVKTEVSGAKQRLDEKTLSKVYPIIIDGSIKFDDPRIPDWLRTYNMKPISRSSVAARRIHTKLREICWKKYPKLELRDNFFAGRNSETDKFEGRIHDFFLNKPLAIFCSGFPGVGRRTLLHYSLRKTDVTQDPFKPASIAIDRDASIEEFILKLNDFGLIDFGESLLNMNDKSLDEKVSIIHKFMDAAHEAREIFYIVDSGAIANYQKEVSDWFKKAILEYEGKKYPVFCIASKYKVIFKNQPKSDLFFFLELSELSVSDRKNFFSKLCGFYNLDITEQQFTDVCNVLSGYPDQVKYAADMLLNDSQINFEDKIVTLAQYNSDKASVLLAKHENCEKTSNFIRMLSRFEVISTEFIFSIVDEETYYPILEDLAAQHIVELIGLDNEIVRVNDIVRDYIARNRIKLDPELQRLVSEKVAETVRDDNLFELDSSETIFSIKESLKNGIVVDERFMIPTHYLRCMKDLYHNRGSLKRIIELADIILAKKDNIDSSSLQDIRYYLCLALAKTKNDRFMTEVQLIKGDEHSFLLGFFYRLQGRFDEALTRFNLIKDKRYVNARAKREIVQVYVQLGEYEKALKYAKENYEKERGNQFHTQAYFNSLINSDDAIHHERKLKELIDNLRSINSEQSIEMADIADALFHAKIKQNKTRSLDLIKDCVARYPDNHYPLLGYCDIALIFSDKIEFKTAIEKIQNLNDSQLSSRTLNRYLALDAAFSGDEDGALNFVRRDLDRYPEESRIKLCEALRELARRNLS
ncbi:toll/interleukin-1 receptor domain-containing protein [Vibrio sp. H11]|uniref:toll/interleukin-1 receptor domain-containing protein n=1 Tax=Vibrio sp. H11 TaxID=2565928 RepID=UPI0010A625FA|nr:toll/interleukin-1 receptor domain-containing protein [Vibrio sp. H11]